jgi:putative transposase
MPRRRRTTPAGFVYHVMNRAAGRLVLFETPSDYIAFEHVLSLGQHRTNMRILAYCLMRNHWHLLLWPDHDGALTTFAHWVTTVHARRWVLAHDSVGRGAVYQSRFKAIPVQTNQHLLTVWRYIERNPVRASLVSRAELWPWSSLGRSRHDQVALALSKPPIQLPEDWIEQVNRPATTSELQGVREAIDRGTPYGDADWPIRALGLWGFRARGRPKRGRTPFSELPPEKGVRPLF